MTIDLFIASLVLIFALLGMATGAARQVAQLLALGAASVASRYAGPLLGPFLAEWAKIPHVLGTVGAVLLVFIFTLILVRMVITAVLRRFMGGGDPEKRLVDRTLGFLLGGGKVALITYVMVCGLVFVENNVTVAGKKLGASPKESRVFAAARRWNVFEMALFSGAGDLLRVAQAASDPVQGQRLKKDPAFQALRKDPRFRQVLDSESLRKSIASGDARALLRHKAVLDLIQDPQMTQKLAEAAAALQ